MAKRTSREDWVEHGDPARCHHDHCEDHTHAELRESAYRRGVQHGIHFLLTAIKEGASQEEIDRWYRMIGKWRFREGKYSTRRDRVIRPPQIVVVQDEGNNSTKRIIG